MKYIYIGVLFILTCYIVSHAQHFPQHSQYFLNNFLVNPALAGIEEYVDIKMSGRTQWTNVEGAPLTNYLSVHLPVNFREKPTSVKRIDKSNERMQGNHASNRTLKPHHGLGGWVLRDQSGNYQRLEATLSYSYHLPINRDLRLSMGVSGGTSRREIDFSNVRLANSSDPIVSAGRDRRWQPLIMAGGWLYHKDFYIGFSFLRYLRSDVISTIIDENDIAATNSEQFFVTAAYKWEINRGFQLIPSVLVKKVIMGSPLQVDANVKAVFYERIWGGISFRELQSLNTFIGIVLSPSIEVNYTYDFGFGGFDQYSIGNHEILVGFRLKNKKKIHCPNYFW